MSDAKPPSARQMRYLRNLATQRGESFAYPQTAAEASAEIERLKGRRRSSASRAPGGAPGGQPGDGRPRRRRGGARLRDRRLRLLGAVEASAR